MRGFVSAPARPGRYEVEVLAPCSLVGDGAGVADVRAAFERVWARLPAFEEDNAFIALPGEGLFLKGQRIRPRIHQETLRQARRLIREVECLRRVAAAGVPVPEVVAFGTHRRFGAHVRTFLIQRLIPDAVELRTIVRSTRPGDNTRAAVLLAVGKAIAAMHGVGAFHRDLASRNILVRDSESAPRVTFIDCPRAEVLSPGSRAEGRRRSDLFRLTRNIRRYDPADDELLDLLRTAGADDPDAYLRMARRFEGDGLRRDWSVKLWLATGREA